MKLKITVYECDSFVESKIFSPNEIVKICEFRDKYKGFPDVKLVSDILEEEE